MDLDKYQSLTGVTVSSTDADRVNAQIKRMRAKLELILGYTLKKNNVSTNYYEEKGKRQTSCEYIGLGYSTGFDSELINSWPCSSISGDETLDEPDDIVGSYRLFEYNRKDVFLSVDPFMQLNAAKLVFIQPGDEPNGITVKTFDNSHLQVNKIGSLSKYISRCNDCWCSCYSPNLQLAIDAEWLYEDCLPDDLLYLWADMVTFYSDDNNNIRSQSLGTHSYTKYDRLLPEELETSRAIISKYVGPNGSFKKVLTI